MTLNFSNIEGLISSRINSLSVDVTAASGNGTTITYISNNSFTAGQSVTISGLSTAAFNLQNVTIASANTTQFTVTSSATGTAVTGSTTGKAIVNIDTKELLLQMKAIETATTNLSLGKVVSEGLYQQASLTSIANQIAADVADFQSDLTDLYAAINDAGNVTVGGTQSITGEKTILSPILTGTPVAPTAVAGTNTTQIATTAFVISEVSSGISNLIGSSPTLLNTLQELAAAINNDPTFFTTISNGLSTKAPINSPTFTGTVTLPANTSGASLVNIPNSGLVNSSVTINGTTVSLGGSASTYPAQTSNEGKFLTTNGSIASWGVPFYQVIEQDNTPTVTQRLKLNFIGATVSDDLTNNRTTVTINSNGGTSGYALVKQVEAIIGTQILYG